MFYCNEKIGKKSFLFTNKIKAFTLAEVLITLAIIGVIAAITIPTLAANHRKEETLSRLKKFYSTLNQVVLKAQADGNNWNYWAEMANASNDETSETVNEFAKQYVLPYMIYHKYEIKGRKLYVYLNDGSYFQMQKGGCLDFIIDVNGDRKPNMYGRDKFVFLYCPDTKGLSYIQRAQVMPYHIQGRSREETLNRCKENAFYCSGVVAIDNWQFKDDYPYPI